jgi:hypothetical protein
MKALFIGAALSALAVSASAQTLTAEYRAGDVNGNAPSSEAVVQYSQPYNSMFSYGGEIAVRQSHGEGPLRSQFAPNLKAKLPTVAGVTPVLVGELGYSMQQRANDVFWGAAVNLYKPVYGPVTANIGYRHREGFRGDVPFLENRLSAGAAYALNAKQTVGVEYYRTQGTVDAGVVAVKFAQKF